MGFRWVLLKLFSQVLHNTRYNYFKRLLLSWYYECQIALYPILFPFRHKNLNTLNNIRALLRGVLIYVHKILCMQKSLCMHIACTLVTMHRICHALSIKSWNNLRDISIPWNCANVVESHPHPHPHHSE